MAAVEQPEAVLSSEMASQLRAGFDERIQALREAAEDWGVKPHHPEGAFVSAMIGTQVGFVEVALGLAAGFEKVIADARTMAKESAKQQQLATAAAQQSLKLARSAADVLETEKVKVTTEMIKRVVPELVKGVREAVVIRERRYNRYVEWRRAILSGAALFGLVISGYIWRTVQDWSLLSQTSYENTAIQRCQDTSLYKDANGQLLCQLGDFLPR